MIRTLLAATAIAAIATSLPAQTKPAPQSKAAQAKALKEFDERPAKYVPAVEKYGYIRRVVDIPMRDGVKLHTIIAIPRGAKDVGMLMTRTPYDAESSASDRPGIYASLPGAPATGEDAITASGYIRVFQDVRGMHGSEGQYSMNPAPVGTPFNPTRTDDSTDTYDTIDWLVKNVPESNKRVGIIGISYDGFLSLMPLINPHPALKVAVPMNPMVDGWRGDDWFHNGAFRQTMMGYMLGQEATRDASAEWIQDISDDYDWYLKGGSAGDIAKKQGLEQVGFWRKVAAHPAYDTYWQSQAMDQVLAKQPLKVPVMVVHSLWDQEDIYGGPAVYKALEAKDANNDMVFLTMGPWFHGQGAGDGSALGGVKWSADTALWWRRNVLAVPGALSEERPAGDGCRAGDGVPVGRERVAAVAGMARSRCCGAGEAVPEAGRCAGVRRGGGRRGDGGVYLRSRRAGRIPCAAAAQVRFGQWLAQLAGRRPAHGVGATRCARLPDRAADAGGHRCRRS